ncbi:putative transmembrane TraG-like protein of type IV secretion system [Roseibium sp. TrichSKD4]|uniref:type IV secretory system conjugative DNA transfer family protein n=1 Tax=Roseibium sp. TrichSKD4 TaxID=744980 RepID=UPI0001E5699E|nr:type IV secretory system conjugative DNA transfer family protein [Roseibium sp. TrichSKD4]EFO30633.1 putative transmembrane TraG-like protein of type IV secretion system [Roseibium sp. TrichSKD4]
MTDKPKIPRINGGSFPPSAFLKNKTERFITGLFLGLFGMIIAAQTGVLDSLLHTRLGHYAPDLTMYRVSVVLISGAIGFVIGWLIVPAKDPLRQVTLGVMLGGLIAVIILDHGQLGWMGAAIGSAIAFAVGVHYWTGGLMDKIRQTPNTFGTAAWATIAELMQASVLTLEGFVLGYVQDPSSQTSEPLSYTGVRHLLTIASNRSGKGTSAIIPNLLRYAGSVLVVDPKGENAMITAKCRKALGQAVYIIDPWGITGMAAACFNPLDWLVAGDVDISDNAMLLADAIIMASGGDERFWDEEAKALLLGLILYVALSKDEDGRRHLGRVSDLLLPDGAELNALFKNMLASPNHVVRSTGARCLQKEEKLLSNVMASVQAQTHFLDSPRLRESLSRSDFRFEDLKTKAMSVYLVLPADKLNSHERWLRLLIQQALTVNARNIEQTPDKPVLFLLDEMPALGKLTMVEQAFGLMAGFGIQIWGICQDLSQLKRIYGDGWETFVSNAGMIQYFGSRDNMTAEYFSKLCGVTTVWDVSTALARAIGVSNGQHTSHSSTTTDTESVSGKQRKLAYADELMRLPDDHQLVFIENMNPIKA